MSNHKAERSEGAMPTRTQRAQRAVDALSRRKTRRICNHKEHKEHKGCAVNRDGEMDGRRREIANHGRMVAGRGTRFTPIKRSA